jgi:hypothetical protein
MKRNELLIAAGMLTVAAGTMVAMGSPAPTPQRRPMNPGIDVAIASTGALTNGSIGLTFWNQGAISLPTGQFAVSGYSTSCNEQPDNGPPTARFAAGNPGIVAGSQFWMGDWYAPFESGTNWDGTNLGVDAGNRHPYIAQQMYRINAEGRLEQLATGWFKHSWSAASGNMAGQVGTATGNDPCGIGSSCFNLNTDNQLESNCADTYSYGHNSDTYYMGPRSEVNPHKGWNDPGWTRFGSYVDAYTNTDTLVANVAQRTDGIRSLTTSGTAAAWKQTRVNYDEISPASLGASGRVIYEGYYVVNGDGYKLNNVAHRRMISSLGNGATSVSASNFTFEGRHTWGPAVLQWGEQKSLADPSTDGEVYVSSRAVSLGGGRWRYEYNVYNLDLDRRVASFEVPIPSFANVEDVSFRQPRQLVLGYDTANWTSSYDGTKKALVWTPPAPAAKTDAELAAMVPPLPAGTVMKPNTIIWGTMYTFWFTCDLDPRSNVMSSMGTANTGSFNGPLTAEVRGPRHPADVGVQGAVAGADGVRDNNDFIVFIDMFFNSNLAADMGTPGGAHGHDGVLDNNDFIAFFDYFFQD